MNELKIFKYESNEIRTVVIENEPWWVANDVCGVLGLTNTTEALKGLDEDEKTTLRISEGGPERNLISEAGLYSLIIRSNKPEAKAFKRWVTHEVIPSIRKHGAYMTAAKIEEVLADPDTIIRLATELKAYRQELAVKNQLIGELKPKADYTDMVLKSTGLMTISQIAQDYGLSANKMNQLLNQLKVHYKQNGQWLLYSPHHGKGYTHSYTIDFTHKDGRPGTKLNTQWTQKGRLFIYQVLKAKGILPMIEKGDCA